jgi:hypothetical protein
VGDGPAGHDDAESPAKPPRPAPSDNVREPDEGDTGLNSPITPRRETSWESVVVLDEVVESPKLSKKKKKHSSAHLWE